MAEHTPGPWVHDAVTGSIHDSDNRFVAVTWAPNPDGVPTNFPDAQANADYICRACNAHDDLLAACEAIRDGDRLFELAAAFRAHPAEPPVNLLDKHFPELRAAIARAKGEAL